MALPGLPRPEDEEENPFALPNLAAPLTVARPQQVQQTTGNVGGGGASTTVVPGPGGMPMVAPERTDRSGWSRSEKKVIADPAAVAAMEAAEAARVKQQTANEALRAAKVGEADAAAQGAQMEVDARKEADLKLAEQLKLRDTAVNAKMAERDQAKAAMTAVAEKSKTSYWEDRAWPAKIMAAILVGAGQYAATGRGVGGRNGAFEIFQQAEAADRQRKIENFKNSKELYEAARQGVDAENALWKAKVEEWDHQTEAKMKTIGSQGTLLAKKSGKPRAIAEADAYNAKADETIAINNMTAHQRYEGEVAKQNEGGKTVNSNPGGAGGKPTENQAKLGLLGSSMEKDLAIIDSNPEITGGALDAAQSNQLKTTAADKTASSGIIGSFVVDKLRGSSIVPRSRYEGLSEGHQRVVNAIDNAVEKHARILTGTGMPEDEARRAAVQAAPHAGDSPQLIRQKLERLREFAANAHTLSGAAGASLDAAKATRAPAKTPPAKASQKNVQTRTMGGKRYVNDGDGWIEVK